MKIRGDEEAFAAHSQSPTCIQVQVDILLYDANQESTNRIQGDEGNEEYALHEDVKIGLVVVLDDRARLDLID